MDILQKQFFSLIRAGLWNTPADASLFDVQTDWHQLYRIAKMQTVAGIVFDGLQTLPTDKRPERNLYLKWCNQLLQIEENNRALNFQLHHIYEFLRLNEIEPVLLKGQGIAQNYLHPLHRQPGDIDLYIGKKDYARINKLLLNKATRKYEENYKHTGMKWNGVVIESHRVLARLSNPTADRLLQKEIAHWHTTNTCRQVSIDTCTATLPPLNFDVVYILIHAMSHFLNEGIGLRQLCDWVNLLHAQRSKVDKKAIEQLLQQTGMYQAAKVFGVIAVQYLHLPAEELPVPYSENDLSLGTFLLEDIWEGGNFGQFNTRYGRRPRGYWTKKCHTFIRVCQRCYELHRLAPAEAKWYPFMLAVHCAQAQWYRLSKRR